jgi:hypothetical protein
LLIATGCGLEAKSLGTKLAAGRDISNPSIVWAGSRPFVLFETGDTRADPHAVPFDGNGSIEELTQGFPCSGPAQASSSGHFVVVDCSGTIAVFDLESGAIVRSIAGSFDQLQGDTLLFKRTFFGTDYSYLVQIPDGTEQVLGNISQAWFAPSGRLYFLLAGSVLGAANGSGATPNMSNRLVGSFVISPDESTAVVSDVQSSQDSNPQPSVFRVLGLPSYGELMTLPLDNPYCTSCPWLGFSPDSRHFFYAENAQQGAGVLHQYGVQDSQVLSEQSRPGPSLDGLLWSPSGDLALIGESECETGTAPLACQEVYRSTLHLGPSLDPISTTIGDAIFSADSGYLLFQDALSLGRVLVTSTRSLSPDPAAAATVLSPSGSLVDGATFDSATGTAVFWARPNGGKSSINIPGGSYERASLYAASPPAFQVRRLAEEVDSIAVGNGVVAANVSFSPQNQTGDLVLYDLRSGQQRTLASPVSSFWVDVPVCLDPAPQRARGKRQWRWAGGATGSTAIVVPPGCPADSPLLLTFTVRGPIVSDKDGLWAMTVQP